MKRLNNTPLRQWSTALFTSFLLVGCTDDVRDFHPENGKDELKLEFQATIDQISESRADESGFADGDRVGVFVVNRVENHPGTLNLSGNQVNNLALTYDADANHWDQATPVYWLDNETHADFYGYYPFDNALPDVDKYSFEVRADQSVCGDDDNISSYEASDFLWAFAENVTPGTRVNLIFRHKLAGIKVILKQGTGFSSGEWESLNRIVTVDNTVRTANINLSTGEATPYGSFDRHIVASPEGDTYRAVVIPQTIESGKSTIGVTIDGITYSYTREGNTSYSAGKLHTFTLTIDKREGSGKYALSLTNETVSPWEVDSSSHSFDINSYLVVQVPEAGKLKESLQSIGCDLSTLRNLKIIGQLTDEDFQVMRDEMPELTSLNLSRAKISGHYRREIEGQEWWDWPYETMEDMIPENALTHKESLRRLILPDGIKRIGENAFSNLRLTTTLIIPESVTRIDNWAFSCIGEEATVIMPSSLEYIGDYVFYGLEARMELRLGNKVEHIGGGAFYHASGAIGTFNLPANLKFLGSSSFEGCGHDLTGEIRIPLGITEIPESAFYGIGFNRCGTDLIFHDGVKKIYPQAFMGLRISNDVVLPKNLKYIGHYAFMYAHFGGSLSLHNEIYYMGALAFGESNISGDFVYPTSLQSVSGTGPLHIGGPFAGTNITSIVLGPEVMQIEREAFRDCGEMKTVRIGENVSSIGERAFTGLSQLTSIICMAKEPPALVDNSFENLSFDRVILEVPEGSVDIYRNTNGWNNFQNITPHRELSVSLSRILCLENGIQRDCRLTAEDSWTVSECPSWVRVSQVSGQTKDELVITVDPLPNGEGDREGRIVFNLTGKDYSTYTEIRQIRCDECAEDTEIVLQESSAGSKSIPVFIVGEGFDADNIADGEYMRRMRETMDQLFAIEPYKSYRDCFIVTTAAACSPDRGVGDVFTLKTNCFDTDWLTPDENKLREYVGKVSKYAGHNMENALIIVVANRECFDGWSTIGHDGCSIACIGITDGAYPYDQRGLVQHYAGGEAFAGLGTEAVCHFDHIKGCTCGGCNQLSKYNELKKRGYLENLTISSKMSDAPWSEFIFHPKYSAIVDMWEGGYNHFRGVWRSEANSVMNSYIPYFNTISRYAIYKQIKRRSGETGSLEDFIANDIIEIP